MEKMQRQDPIVFVRMLLENAWLEGDTARVMRLSQIVDEAMLSINDQKEIQEVLVV